MIRTDEEELDRSLNGRETQERERENRRATNRLVTLRWVRDDDDVTNDDMSFPRSLLYLAEEI